jgi:AmmeMemoRadiSam system protein A
MSAFSPVEHKALLAIARSSIAEGLAERPLQPPENSFSGFSEARGAFVTLKLAGDLRGCIGLITSEWPLWETVARMARAAAFEDPRFDPLDPEEFERVTLEISVLTVPAPVDDMSTIEVGRDGLIVEQGASRGLLLPQVATEWGWDRETLLDQTCLKAGLGAGAWRDPLTRVFSFSAEVFGE